MITGDKKVIRDLEALVAGIEASPDAIGREFKDRVKEKIRFVGAIDTAAMINAIDYTRSFVVDNGHSLFVGAVNNPDVFYDGFVERDTRNRDGTVRGGKFFYEQAIQPADVEGVYDAIVRRAFIF